MKGLGRERSEEADRNVKGKPGKGGHGARRGVCFRKDASKQESSAAWRLR